VVDDVVTGHCPANMHPDEWDLKPLIDMLEDIYLPRGRVTVQDLEGQTRDELVEYLDEAGAVAYAEKEAELGEEAMRDLERMVLLRVLDSKWMEHLDAMDNLREGVGLRAYGQRDPLVEYKREAYDMYQEMMAAIREEAVRILFHVEMSSEEALAAEPEPVARVVDSTPGVEEDPPAERSFQVIQGGRPSDAPGPNDPCWCGSGKKYRKCHGSQQVSE
jgi:preprotein translocase subunit SecA